MNDYSAGLLVLATLLGTMLAVIFAFALPVIVLRLGLAPLRREVERIAVQLETDADIRGADETP